jgi:hypothetical protein
MTNSLTPWDRVIHEAFTTFNKFPTLYGARSCIFSQYQTLGRYTEPDKSIPLFSPCLSDIHSNVVLTSTHIFPSYLFPSPPPTKVMHFSFLSCVLRSLTFILLDLFSNYVGDYLTVFEINQSSIYYVYYLYAFKNAHKFYKRNLRSGLSISWAERTR